MTPSRGGAILHLIMIQRHLGPHADRAYALLRIMAGLTFSFHGVQKILHLFPGKMPPPAPWTQFWFGGIIELVCGLAIAVGLLTSWAAFLASGQMAVAYFQFHYKIGEFTPKSHLGSSFFFPGVNGGEMAVLYCFVFLFIACKGSGPWSIDVALGRQRPA